MLSGIITSVNLVQFENAKLPILITFPGIETLLKLFRVDRYFSFVDIRHDCVDTYINFFEQNLLDILAAVKIVNQIINHKNSVQRK